jgi:hypothetical protein
VTSASPAVALLAAINQRFINEVGPIGELLIEDTKRLWHHQRWHGPAAFRHYIKHLADNIDDVDLQERFLADAGQMLLQAQRSVATAAEHS